MLLIRHARRYALQAIKMPALSPTMEHGIITKWALEPGTKFSAGDVLFEVETDKAQMSVEAPDDGVMARILKKDGEVCDVNIVIGFYDDDQDLDVTTLGEDAFKVEAVPVPKMEPAREPKEKPAQDKEPEISEPPKQIVEDTKTPTEFSGKDSPAVTILLDQYDLQSVRNQIAATGPKGRILKGDVLAYIDKEHIKPVPVPVVKSKPAGKQPTAAKHYGKTSFYTGIIGSVGGKSRRDSSDLLDFLIASRDERKAPSASPASSRTDDLSILL